ncbi:MAG: endopeptidase La [Ureaplasma sp.]|nr:endopeptidase La [Ureaplasma sp.]
MYPLLAIRGLFPFANNELLIKVAREQSKKSIEIAMNDYQGKIILAPQLNLDIDKPKLDDLSRIGALAKIKNLERVKNKNGEEEFLVIFKVNSNGFYSIKNNNKNKDIDLSESEFDFVSYEISDPTNEDLLALNNLCYEIVTNTNDYFQENKEFRKTEKYIKKIFEIYENEKGEISKKYFEKVLSNFYDVFPKWNDKTAPTSYRKQYFDIWTDYYQTFSISKKIEILNVILVDFTPEGKKIAKDVDADISKKMSTMMNKQQKEFYLREKLKIIKEELGEISNRDDESEVIKKRLKNNPYPEHIKQKILSELGKYESAFTSNESGMVKTYIDWLLDLPWWQTSQDNLDLKHVQKVLDSNHYGIEKVKERIIEYIAMRLNNQNASGSIICLVGPPGVGKTSLAKSIAEALNKVYVKVALGGVKDESEIRGHRRTYLGAMPGRIIKAMKKAKVINPLFLLDEIDKMSSDFKGDPASAMLEVLDPEQNKLFSDNYIEEEYDLSKVMFICTANYYNQIPAALIDRLEIIELSSYTANEKKEIAKNYLVDRVLKKANLTKKDIQFTDEAIDYLINYYSREAGVRELERLLEQIVRKSLVAKLKGTEYEKVITPEIVTKLLGKQRFDVTIKEKQQIPGIVNGMAYTAAGGDLLPIEATYFPGKGNIIITGNLEKTMNESVSVAFGYVKANAEKFGIKDIKFNEIDVHLHVPAGGIPKDGPSAGVTITTALISLFRNEPVSSDISMTGEIMLRGKVGIIGGVKEKVISAQRAGIKNIFLPKDDERFLEDIPKEILNKLTINLVEKYDDIFNKIFNK